MSSATCRRAPQPAQTPVAVVISAPNTSASRPAIALPSRASSAPLLSPRTAPSSPSAAGSPARRGRLRPSRRSSSARTRRHEVLCRPGDVGEQARVDSARVARPARWLFTSQRVNYLCALCWMLELSRVDHVRECAGRVEQAHGDVASAAIAVSQHGPQRDDAGAARDEEQRSAGSQTK